MSIDSAAKRKSMLSMGQTAITAAFMHPDATQPQGWRQTALWGYYGIDWATVVDTARTALHGSGRLHLARGRLPAVVGGLPRRTTPRLPREIG
jgi:hypothetical protein